MRLSLADLAARAIRLEWDDAGPPRHIHLERLTGVSGEANQNDDGVSLRPFAADQAIIARAEWPLAGGEIAIASPVAVRGLACAAELADGGLHGRITAAAVEGRAIAIALPDLRLTTDIRAGELTCEQAVSGGHAGAASVALAGLELAIAGQVVRCAEIALDQPRCDWGVGDVLVAAARMAVGRASVGGGGLAIELDAASLPAGLLTSAGAVVIPELAVPEVSLTVADLAGFFAVASAPSSGSPPREPPPSQSFVGQLDFLDRLAGQLDVDLTAALVLPVVGTRRATHRFRVPIQSGTFNYKELENDLARLEDAFIDIEVRGRTLAIERRIPLVPGSEKSLVLFDLDDRELELARRRLARLACLATLRLPAGDDGPSPVELIRLDFAIDAGLTLAPPTDDRPDLARRASVGMLRVTGALRFAPDRELEQTRIAIAAEAIAAGPGELVIEGITVAFDRLTIGRLDADVDFAGFAPGATRITVRDLSIHNLRLGTGSVDSTTRH